MHCFQRFCSSTALISDCQTRTAAAKKAVEKKVAEACAKEDACDNAIKLHLSLWELEYKAESENNRLKYELLLRELELKYQNNFFFKLINKLRFFHHFGVRKI